MSAREAVCLVRAVAEGLVRRAPAAAERGALALVEDRSVGVEDAHAAADEQRSVRRSANLERLRAQRALPFEPAGAERARGAEVDGALDVIGGRGVGRHPGPAAAIEDLRQRVHAVLRMKAEARLPLDDDLV